MPPFFPSPSRLLPFTLVVFLSLSPVHSPSPSTSSSLHLPLPLPLPSHRPFLGEGIDDRERASGRLSEVHASTKQEKDRVMMTKESCNPLFLSKIQLNCTKLFQVETNNKVISTMVDNKYSVFHNPMLGT